MFHKAVKVVDSGDYYEVWIYQDLSVAYKDSRKKAKGKKRTFDELNGNEQVQSLQRKVKYYTDKRWEIMRIVNLNYDDRSSFLTLTFKDDVTNIDYANSEFRKFIKRLCTYLYGKESGLKYLATWEIQKEREKKTGKAVIHYHIIMFDVPFIPHDRLTTIWRNGNVWINKIDDIDNKGLYVSKYFAKDLDLKTHKKKAYFTSRGLRKPTEKRFIIDSEADLQELLNKGQVMYESAYESIVPQYEFGQMIFDKKQEVRYYSVKKIN